MIDQELKIVELNSILTLLEDSNLVFRLGRKIFDCPEYIFDTKPNLKVIAHSLEWAEIPGNHIISIKSIYYPELLKEIANPPVLLFVQGDLDLLKAAQIAMVGSRNPTPQGVHTAFKFAKELVGANLTITSGFALGIDAASHKGAISVNGKTIAVMGTGLLQLYPKQHHGLAQQIIEAGGALVSEFGLNAKGSVWRFPLRNRIISGLSMGVTVVEATMRSGSLITARLACEQGREVFAIPGSIYNPAAKGCHYLINQGAKLVDSSGAILEELGYFSKSHQATINTSRKASLDADHKKLLTCMGFDMVTVDELIVRSGCTAQQVSAMLVELELNDYIKPVAGGYVVTSD